MQGREPQLGRQRDGAAPAATAAPRRSGGCELSVGREDTTLGACGNP